MEERSRLWLRGSGSCVEASVSPLGSGGGVNRPQREVVRKGTREAAAVRHLPLPCSPSTPVGPAGVGSEKGSSGEEEERWGFQLMMCES